MDRPKQSEKPNPRGSESVFSKLTFRFMEPLFGIDSTKKFNVKDCFQPYDNERLDSAGSCLQREWSKEMEKYKKGGKVNLRLALARAFWVQYALTGIFIILRDACKFVSPVLFHFLMGYFTEGSEMSKTTAMALAGGIALSNLVQGCLGPHFIVAAINCCHRWRAGIVDLLYKKIIKLPQSTFSEMTSGHIVDLVTSDADRFGWLIWHLHDIWSSPLHLCVCVTLIYHMIGWPVFSGLAIVLVILPLQGIIIFKCHKTWKAQSEKTDERVSMMSEVLGGMRVIKMYCWEKPFGELIDRIRQSELNLIWKGRMAGNVLGEMSHFNKRLLTSVIVVVYMAIQNDALSAAKVFPMLSVINILADTVLGHTPWGWKAWMEVSVCANRIEEFLVLPEREANSKTLNGGSPRIVLNNVCAHWEVKQSQDKEKDNNNNRIEQKPVGQSNDATLKSVLQNIDVDICGDKLLAIVGPVGSGKSSLLMAILKELQASSGSVHVNGSTSYSSQQPWVFSSTIRQNILFGKDYEADKYAKVVEASALIKDLESLPHGDKSLVGEKGVTLSGGQKARVALARALYADSDIILLDDPLSAVDAEVGSFLYNKCINGFLKHKLRVLVTHQTQFLRDADQIIVLNKEGQIDDHGSYKKLVASGNTFMDHDSQNTPLNETIDSDEISDKVRSKIIKEFKTQASKLEDEEEEDEDKFVGKITWRSYLNFFTAGSNLTSLLAVVVISFMAQAANNYSDWWLAYWTQQSEEQDGTNYSCEAFPYTQYTPQESCPANSTIGLNNQSWLLDTNTGIGIYLGLTILTVLLRFGKSWIYRLITMNSSRSLHDQMYQSVIHSPVRFYDANPKGRILSRFSGDTGAIDGRIPQMIMTFLENVLSLGGNIMLILSCSPWTLAPVIPLTMLTLHVRNKFCKLNSRLDKSNSEARSPMLTHLSSTIDGITTIRAFGVDEKIIEGYQSHYNAMIGGWTTGLHLWAWFQIRNNLIHGIFNMIALFIITLSSETMSAAQCGLAMSYIMPMMSYIDSLVRDTAEMENEMVKSERVLNYTKLKPEADLHSKNPPPESWPEKGKIEFRNVVFKYHETAPEVLKNLNLCIAAGSKVGVVGRTGAGKSSLIQALFRMAEPMGDIIIDDLPTSDVGLHELRNQISIIPQDPVLFKGSLRYNIDPFNCHSDEDIWNVLNEVQLKDSIDDLEAGLEYKVSEGGSNFSIGQKQLFCLARAILRNNKILLIDEATANVDKKTDLLIQSSIRKKFADCTVITIAHRINTIMDSDKILVMSEGQAAEYDSPEVLLQSSTSHFSKLAASSGLKTSHKTLDSCNVVAVSA